MPSDTFKKSRRFNLSLDLEAAEPVRQQMRNCPSPLAADGVGADPFHQPYQPAPANDVPDLASFTRLSSNLTLCTIQGVGDDADSPAGGRRSDLANSYQHGGSSITLLSPNGGAFLSSSPLLGLAGGGVQGAYQPEPSYLHHVPTAYGGGSNSTLAEMAFAELEGDMGVDAPSPTRAGFACSTTSSYGWGAHVDSNYPHQQATTLGIDIQLQGGDAGKAIESFQQSLSLPVQNDEPITPLDSGYTRALYQHSEQGNPLYSPSTSPQLPKMLPFPDTSDRSVHRTSSHPTAPNSALHHQHNLVHRCESLPALSNPQHRHFSNSTFTNNSSLSGWGTAVHAASTPVARQGSSPVSSSQILAVPLPIDANPADIISLGTPLFSTMGALANNAGFDLLDTKSYRLVHDAYLGSGNGGTVRRVKRVPVSLGYFLATPDAANHRFHNGNLAFSQCDVFGSLLPSPSCAGHHLPSAEVPSQQPSPSSQTTHTPPAASSSNNRSQTSIAGNVGNNVSSNSIPFKSPPSPGDGSSSEVADQPTNSSPERSPNTTAAVSGLLKASRKRRDRLASAAGPILRRETMQCPAAPPIDSVINGDSLLLTAESPANASSAVAFNALPCFPPSRGGSIVEDSAPHASPPTQQGRRTDSYKGILPARRGTIGAVEMPQILSTSFMSVSSSHHGGGSAKGVNVLPSGSASGSHRQHSQISLPSATLNRAASLSPANSGSFFSAGNTPNVQSVPPNHRLGSQYNTHPSGHALISPTAATFSGPTYFALKEINLNSQERVEEIQRELKNLVASHRYYYYPTDSTADSETSPRNRRRRSKRRHDEATSRRASRVSFVWKAATNYNGSSSPASNQEASTSPLSRSLSPQQHLFHKRGGGGLAAPWASFGSARSISCTEGLERMSMGSKSGGVAGYVPYPVSCNNVVDYFGAFQHENTIVIVMELLENSVDTLLRSHMKRHVASSPIMNRNQGSSSSVAESSGSPVNGRPPLAPPPNHQHAEKSTTPPRSPSSPSPKMDGLPLRWVSLIARDVLRGLLFLHKVRTLVHRDLKPGNLLFTTDPTVGARRTQSIPQASPPCRGVASNFSDPHSNNASTTMAPSALVKIADFGVSHEFNGDVGGVGGAAAGNGDDSPPKSDTTTTFIGSVSYMSPERLRNDPYGYPSDIWSLGILLLELATGTHPFNNALTKNGQRSVASLRQEERFWCILGHLGRDESWTKSDLACSSSAEEGGVKGDEDGDRHSCSHNIVHLLLPQECRATCPVFADFIERALSKNPERRGTAGELLRHPFLLMHCDHDPNVLAEINSLFADELADFTERTGVSVYGLVPGILPASRSQSSTPGSSTIHMMDPQTPKTHNIPFFTSPFAQSRYDPNYYGTMAASVEGSYANEGNSFASKNRSSLMNPPTRSQSLTEPTAITTPSAFLQHLSQARNSASCSNHRGSQVTELLHSQSHDELPNFTRGAGMANSCEGTATLLGFRRRSSVLFSPSVFSFNSTPGHISHGLSGVTTKDFALESDSNTQSQHRTSIGGADSQQGALLLRRRATSSAEDITLPPLGDYTMVMDDEGGGSRSSSRLDAPFHLPPPLPNCRAADPPEALNNLRDEDPSLTAVMRQKEEGDQLVLAAFKETMQPVDTDHLHQESEQEAYSSANQARMMPPILGGDSYVNEEDDQPTLHLCTALRVRNVMVSLLTGNQPIEQSERAELALFIRSTLSTK